MMNVQILKPGQILVLPGASPSKACSLQAPDSRLKQKQRSSGIRTNNGVKHKFVVVHISHCGFDGHEHAFISNDMVLHAAIKADSRCAVVHMSRLDSRNPWRVKQCPKASRFQLH